nr:hypothetical protein BaRGS_009773 [Batillaria attramentaria]
MICVEAGFLTVRAFSILGVLSMATCGGLFVLTVVKSDLTKIRSLTTVAASAGVMGVLLALISLTLNVLTTCSPYRFHYYFPNDTSQSGRDGEDGGRVVQVVDISREDPHIRGTRDNDFRLKGRFLTKAGGDAASAQQEIGRYFAGLVKEVNERYATTTAESSVTESLVNNGVVNTDDTLDNFRILDNDVLKARRDVSVRGV